MKTQPVTRREQLYFLAKLLLFAIFAQLSPAHSIGQSKKIRIDPSQYKGASVSDVFQKVTYIPLETTKESSFGRIDQLAVTDSFYVILDYDTNSILIFKKNGKFHRKIKGSGNTKTNSFSKIFYFILDKQHSEIFFKASETTLHCYNFDGQFQRDVEIPLSKNIYLFPDNKWVYSNFSTDFESNLDTTYSELTWLTNEKPYMIALPYRTKNLPFGKGDMIYKSGNQFFPTSSDTIIRYSRPFDYNVYTAGPGHFKIDCSIVLPAAYSLPPDFSSSNLYYRKRFLYLMQEHRELVYALSNIFKIQGTLFFQLCHNNSSLQKEFIYNEKDQELYSVANIDPDASNYFLPINSSVFPGFFTIDGNSIYAGVTSYEMQKWKELAKGKKVKFNDTLKDFFNRKDKFLNPVLVRLELKLQ